MRTICAALVAVVTLGGCGDDDDEAPIQQPDIDEAEIDASNYDIGYTVCAGTLAGEINDDSTGITADPATEPEMYAIQYAEEFYAAERRQAPQDGCLDGLLGNPKNPPG
jgi:hypothetical protein